MKHQQHSSRGTYMGSTWTFGDADITAAEAAELLTEAFHGGHGALRRVQQAQAGRAFRANLERKITANEVRKAEERTAPDEVMHRRVAGKTVISRRLR